MTYSNKFAVNFAGGEVAPGVSARIDLPLANKVLARMENFIAEPMGPAKYRTGTRYVHHTRNNNKAAFIEFQFSDVQAYIIEATEGYFRFYKDEALILNSTTKTITGASAANPCVITAVGHGYTTGQEVYLTGIGGMTELNGRFFIVTRLNANTFSLQDVFGNNIDSSAYTAYTSGGTAANVYEVQTPYLEEDLMGLSYAQNADTMYINSRRYAPRKLTRTNHDNWTLARYARTAATDPFETNNSTYGEITAITLANPGVISDAGHTFAANDNVFISGIVGTTELNNRHFKINTTGAGTYTLKDPDTGTPIDTSAYTAWVSGGIVEKVGATSYPGAVAFTDDARVAHAGTDAKPETIWFSRSPSAAGAVRFDDFTSGTNDDDAVTFTLAPLRGRVDSIRWVTNTDKYIAFGTFGSIRRMYGDVETASITPTAVTAKAANSDGVASARPVVDGVAILYIARSGLKVESLEYDYQVDGYVPDDKNLVSSHITRQGLTQIARQIGSPTIIWAVRNDGVLLGLTYKAKENIAGWHRHTLGGDGVVEAIGIMPRESNAEQLWLSVKRNINGNTVRYVEFMTDSPRFPVPVDFFTGSENSVQDNERFLNYQSEMMRDAIHVDASLTYDGSAYGTAAGASITMGDGAQERETENVIVTASAAVFTSDMVGRQIHGAYTSEGIGGGRIEITNYTSTTQIEGTIIDEFPATATYEAGDWYLTATSVSGLDHLEGQTVTIVTDGAVPEPQTVESGAITIDQPAAVIHVGMGYLGIMQTLPLDQGGQSGPAQNKTMIVAKTAIRFIDSAGVLFGSDLYNLTRIEFRRGNDFTDRPVPLFTGADESSYEDKWEQGKVLYVLQDTPMPCMVAGIDVYMETADE